MDSVSLHKSTTCLLTLGAEKETKCPNIIQTHMYNIMYVYIIYIYIYIYIYNCEIQGKFEKKNLLELGLWKCSFPGECTCVNCYHAFLRLFFFVRFLLLLLLFVVIAVVTVFLFFIIAVPVFAFAVSCCQSFSRWCYSYLFCSLCCSSMFVSLFSQLIYHILEAKCCFSCYHYYHSFNLSN